MKPTRVAVALVLTLLLGACGEVDRPATGNTKPVAEPDVSEWRTWVLPSAAAVPVPPPAGSTSGASSGNPPPVNRWLDLAMDFVSQRAKDPPAASRAYALVAVAQYDALVAARYWSKQYSGSDSGDYPSDDAAVDGAASRVLAHLFPEQSALRLDLMAERAVTGSSDQEAAQAGLALGRALADRVIARAGADGSDREWDGTRPPLEPAFWGPPPGSVSPPVQPMAGTWKTWVIDSPSVFRPSPPPAYGSPEYLAEAGELIAMKADLTEEQRRSAKFWEGGEGTSLPPGIWNRVVLDYLAERRVSRAEQVRTLALVNVALADAGVAAWDAKYTYWTPRPENAIRDLLDPEWRPYLRTPLFPAFVSGHSTYSAAVAEVLAGLYPADAGRFREMGEEAGLSRLLGGIHFRSDHVQGSRMGAEIGRKVLERGSAMSGGSLTAGMLAPRG